MADILIRGIKVPDDCDSCIFCINEICQKFCPLTNGYYYWDESSNGSRPDDCPIVPFPEVHGRLIDADALLRDNPELADCDFINKKYDITLRELIEDAQTVVPATNARV